MKLSVRPVLIWACACILLSSCRNGSGTHDNPANTDVQTYQEKVMSVAEIERAQPLQFLSADGTYRENFWGDLLKVKCTIHNTATVATYKDIVIRVTYYSKTKSVITTNDYTVYEYVQPNSEKTVDLKIDTYKDVNSVGWDVVDAKAE